MASSSPKYLDGLENFLVETGKLYRFTANVMREFFRSPFEHQEAVRQAYFLGFKSLSLVSITALIMGLVLTLQSRPTLAAFGAESLLPGMISVSLLREIVPVITALLCAGRISSGIGAELGSMRVTEQIDAMEVSGTNPMNFVVASRILATTIMVPVLVLIADVIALMGSYIAIRISGDMPFILFYRNAMSALDLADFIPAVIKTVFFGFFIGLIGSYKGYNATRGTESVGRAANEAVVLASLLIFIIDLIVVQIINVF